MFRVGFGYDSHRFAKDRKLFLGGVEIESDFGLQGHSDADVLLHALMDALLGAVGSGDIGSHFPDDDPQYKNISSLKLLTEVKKEVENRNFVINNCDLVVVAEKPKLKPYRSQIIASTADGLNLQEQDINFKATTNEKMGFTGRGEGMAAYAVVSVVEKEFWQFFKKVNRKGVLDDVSKEYNDK
ncbi:2-C-methyl-D-erythritol 2,4-cyclodiphosphate synthase [Halanaerobium saccharolyticum]|uniref:2-C-methyl-D-erythritol 2,4-cyclodiphosphate synthase n=1 Tax=Halanaerobium saccharolyticum TaxID=43595 RepID=A0A4R7Z6K3_9FIRM|nr:2-C-methyl-D-erythritol 2,4-cyclodiphosphate synthase [Halanaerobium saccharolyticum]RAK07695.1 2-C-methyl-D-erythritol 2,4-cyclodiphosphate synthase [Halanaerobium saccharolyticum]TDW03695.1 2-C-methyl-D-erythritol 2,4-cyclodiphosphate synthase [Halanaerobium saccharolyticum]TDX59534.1 2-C-methyl-D-erythritol 2,4-cyclodiphosphate synthase [Halanaerobium saccharolyticum]